VAPLRSILFVKSMASSAISGKRSGRIGGRVEILAADLLDDFNSQVLALSGQIDGIVRIAFLREKGLNLIEHAVEFLAIGQRRLRVLQRDVGGEAFVGVLNGMHQIGIQFDFGSADGA